MMKLSPTNLAELCGGKDIRKLEVLNGKGKGIKAIDDLGVCVELSKLDLSENELTSLQGIAHNKSLKWLRADHNKLTTLAEVARLTKLQVLNLGHNQINRIQHLDQLVGLKALILNDNNIGMIENLEKNLELNTLVLSKNRIFDLVNIRHLKLLKKLSVAHNRIRVIPDLSCFPELKEFRINDNKIQSIPENFSLNSNLEVFDAGNNLLRTFDDLKPLAHLLKLENLNLKGNPICDLEGYQEKVKALIPRLKVLDGERFDQAFVHRKMKRKILEKKKLLKAEKGNEKSPTPEPGSNFGNESHGKKRKEREEKSPEEASQKKLKAKKESVERIPPNEKESTPEAKPVKENKKESEKKEPEKETERKELEKKILDPRKTDRSGVVKILNNNKKKAEELRIEEIFRSQEEQLGEGRGGWS